MDLTLPLEEMSTEEKIETMETIWEDLCKNADTIPSPPWHKKTLEERAEGIKNGDDEFVEWDSAKKHIRNETSP